MGSMGNLFLVAHTAHDAPGAALGSWAIAWAIMGNLFFWRKCLNAQRKGAKNGSYGQFGQSVFS